MVIRTQVRLFQPMTLLQFAKVRILNLIFRQLTLIMILSFINFVMHTRVEVLITDKTVFIGEYRNGRLINIHRKDIHIKVSDCIPLKAVLRPDYSYCDDFLVTFKNLQVNPTGSLYTWDFGDGTP